LTACSEFIPSSSAASNMVAPDLITEPVPLSPGTEVWTIRSTVAAPTGKPVKNK